MLLEKKALSSFEKGGNEFCRLFSTYALNEWLMKQNQNVKFSQGSEIFGGIFQIGMEKSEVGGRPQYEHRN